MQQRTLRRRDIGRRAMPDLERRMLARAKENDSAQGRGVSDPFDAARIAASRDVACSPDCPPDRNATPATQAGTARRRQRSVASATSASAG